MCVFYVTSVVPDSLRAHALAHQAPLSMEFSRQEYWSGLPCPSLGDLPNPGVKPVSFSSPVLAGTFFISSTTAVLNLICDNWKYLYIFKCLLTYARVCVCVCVCVFERERRASTILTNILSLTKHCSRFWAHFQLDLVSVFTCALPPFCSALDSDWFLIPRDPQVICDHPDLPSLGVLLGLVSQNCCLTPDIPLSSFTSTEIPAFPGLQSRLFMCTHSGAWSPCCRIPSQWSLFLSRQSSLE